MRRHQLLTAFVLILCACARANTTPTAVPTEPPTATALPPTEVATTASAATAVNNDPVLATSLRLVPNFVAFDADGNMYLATCIDERAAVVKIDHLNLLTDVVGHHPAFSGDGGPALEAGMFCAGGMAFDRDGNLFIAHIDANRVRRIDRNGIITTVAGSGPSDFMTGSYGGDGGPATEALLDRPTSVVFDAAGNLFIADSGNNRIRKVDRQGTITTIAGTGQPGFSGDSGPATAASLNLGAPNPVSDLCGTGIVFDDAGNLYIGDSLNNRIRKIDTQGVITTIAGTGEPGTAGDGGQAIDAQLTCANGMAFDEQGSLFVAIAPSTNVVDHRIRKIDSSGIITTVAGTGPKGFSGDNGPATEAELNAPWSVSVDAAGNLYIAEPNGLRLRRVDANGTITTIAGGKP